MAYSVPLPCNGELYEDWCAEHFALKVSEEAGEVASALMDLMLKIKSMPYDWNPKGSDEYEHVLSECADVLVATVSLMERLGCDEEERAQKIREVNESNARRDGGRRFRK